jgi:hypothetical protein
LWKVPLQELSLFFPCHNEAENLEGLVADALAALPALATTYEVILVDDGSRDDTAGVAERLVQRHGGVVRLVRHEVNRGYGGALRSGFAAARYSHLAYTLRDLLSVRRRHDRRLLLDIGCGAPIRHCVSCTPPSIALLIASGSGFVFGTLTAQRNFSGATRCAGSACTLMVHSSLPSSSFVCGLLA